jgi:phosphoglucomutase
MNITFGTSGWRGIISRDFTWDRAMSVVDAIGVFLSESGFRSVAVGGDCRFLSPELSQATAERLSTSGFEAFLSLGPVPTPVLSHACRSRGLGGVINFTASHNPPLYNGIKFSPSHGGPADSIATGRIEELIRLGERLPRSTGSVSTVDFVAPYLSDLNGFVNADLFRAHDSLRVVYDAFSGAGSGVLDRKLGELGASMRVIHGTRDPLFAGREHPEPNAHGLLELSGEVVRSGASLGVATDGDADRFGIVDENGVFVTPHDFLALLLDYLAESGRSGAAVRSVTTGSLMDRVAAARGIPLKVTPVGFKHLGSAMLSGNVMLAGEESGGLSVGGHVPEKDGVLACLLAAEMVCARGEGLAAQLDRLWSIHGRLYNSRVDIPLSPETRDRIQRDWLDSDPRNAAGRPVLGVDRTDGVKLLLGPDTWVLVRLSGTEPLARVYIQSSSTSLCDELSSTLTCEFGGNQ